MKRRTKIIATVGPAVSSREMLLKLAQEGMDVARLNFSHGHHSEFARIIDDLRSISEELGRPVGILADIQGPKIRVGDLEGKQVQLKEGMEIFLCSDPGFVGGVREGKTFVSVGYKEFVKDVGPGNRVLLDDGLMEIRVLAREGNMLRCEVISGGALKENKGINVPDVPFSVSAITEKDYGDILFCVEKRVDFIALSFVRMAQEVRHLKQFVESRGTKIDIIAKIEKQDALTHLESIIDAADGILVARGDLAVEVGNERVPVLQKKMVRACNLRGKTAIIATQMLMSMVENPRPSRAEASDVANGIVDEADALMLSNETAVGKYPLESVRMMSRIIEEMEEVPTQQPVLYNEWQLDESGQRQIALLQSAVRLSSILHARLIAVVSQSGQAPLLISKCRPDAPVYALTGDPEVYQKLALKWGVRALLMQDMEPLVGQAALFEAVGQRLATLNLCASGDTIIMTAGLPRLARGSTNTIKVHQV
jgi:pyruvate kinase